MSEAETETGCRPLSRAQRPISTVDGSVAGIRRRAWPRERRSVSQSARGSHAVRNLFLPGVEDWGDLGWWHRWNRPRENISMRAD